MAPTRMARSMCGRSEVDNRIFDSLIFFGFLGRAGERRCTSDYAPLEKWSKNHLSMGRMIRKGRGKVMRKRIGFSLFFIMAGIAFTGIATPSSASVLDCPTTYSLNLQPGASFTFNGDTTGYPSYANTYNCSTWDEFGPEIVYRGTSTAIHGNITATLSNLYGVDLDICILNSCDSENCVSSGVTVTGLFSAFTGFGRQSITTTINKNDPTPPSPSTPFCFMKSLHTLF